MPFNTNPGFEDASLIHSSDSQSSEWLEPLNPNPTVQLPSQVAIHINSPRPLPNALGPAAPRCPS